MKKYIKSILIKFVKHSQEKTFQYIKRNKTKCPCFICNAKKRYIDYRIKRDKFYAWLVTVKWTTVEFRGSDFPDFREYEVISTKRVRMPDGKGFQWPKTNYNYVRSVEVAGAT